MQAEVCRCGHEWVAHFHYRPGDDCGLCGRARCGAFRRRRRPGVAWLAAVVLLMAALTVLLILCWP